MDKVILSLVIALMVGCAKAAVVGSTTESASSTTVAATPSPGNVTQANGTSSTPPLANATSSTSLNSTTAQPHARSIRENLKYIRARMVAPGSTPAVAENATTVGYENTTLAVSSTTVHGKPVARQVNAELIQDTGNATISKCPSM